MSSQFSLKSNLNYEYNIKSNFIILSHSRESKCKKKNLLTHLAFGGNISGYGGARLSRLSSITDGYQEWDSLIAKMLIRLLHIV